MKWDDFIFGEMVDPEEEILDVHLYHISGTYIKYLGIDAMKTMVELTTSAHHHYAAEIVYEEYETLITGDPVEWPWLKEARPANYLPVSLTAPKKMLDGPFHLYRLDLANLFWYEFFGSNFPNEKREHKALLDWYNFEGRSLYINDENQVGNFIRFEPSGVSYEKAPKDYGFVIREGDWEEMNTW